MHRAAAEKISLLERVLLRSRPITTSCNSNQSDQNPLSLTRTNMEDLPCIPDAQVALLTSKWHSEYVARIADCCKQLLVQQAAEIELHCLPGTHEFPYAVRVLKDNNPKLSAVICIGIILKGETHHFEMILHSCAYGLTKASLEQDIIVINGIIPATEMEQVKVRASNDQYNKGIELATAAVEAIAWARTIRRLSA